MDFYERVKELVKLQNLSLIPFLQSLGVNYETYKSAKRLNNLPRADEAVKIAEALNTSVEFLVSGNTPTFPKDESKEKAAELAQEIINLLK